METIVFFLKYTETTKRIQSYHIVSFFFCCFVDRFCNVTTRLSSRQAKTFFLFGTIGSLINRFNGKVSEAQMGLSLNVFHTFILYAHFVS